MRRALSLAIGLLLVWLGFLPAASIAAMPMAHAAAAFVYDDLGHAGVDFEPASERGPPAAYGLPVSHRAVSDWSDGASARLESAATLT
ncbi:hypothetical protein [Aeromicrobium sp. P5_D10]